MKQLNDDPADYVKLIGSDKRNDLEFLLSELEVYWTSHPKIMAHLFANCRRLAAAQNNKRKLDKIEALRLRWEVDLEDGSEIEDILGDKSKLTQVTIEQGQSMKDEGSIEASEHIKSSLDRVFKFTSSYGLLVFVCMPVLIFTLYLLLIATPRFESQAQLVIKQSDGGLSSIDPSLALLSGLGGSQSGNDTELVKAYILSNDMINFLEDEIGYTEHFQNSSWDPFSKQSTNATKEERIKYFKQHVIVEIDPKSSIISVRAQAFEPAFANLVTNTIVEQAENFINKIGHDLAKAQLSFVQNEHELTQQKLQTAQSRLMEFQQRYNLLDPEAEGVALQQITFELEGRIASKTAELNALRSSMSQSAPLVIKVQDELNSLQRQLIAERERLTRSVAIERSKDSENDEIAVNAILSKFSDYKIDLEFALQAYSASKLSLEQSRIQAYKQLKYLVTIESATYPEEAKYPRVLYNIVLLAAVLLAFYFIAKMLIATAAELK